MAECLSVENASEEVFEFICGPCNVDGDVRQAKGYYSDCHDYLCVHCYKSHLRLKPLRHHVLLDEKSMPKDQISTSTKASDICTERCEKHSGNIIEYYCQSHDFLGCTKCFISDNHRKCDGVVCIEDTACGIFDSQEFTKFEGTIQQLADVLSESSSLQQQNDENVMIYSIRAKKDIKNFRANMNEYLDRLEHEMDNQVSEMKDRQASQLLSTSKQIEHLEKDIKAIKETVERTRKSEQKSNLYIYMKRNLDELKRLEDRIKTIKKDVGVSEYTFTPDGNLLRQKAKTFGTLVINENAEHVEDRKNADGTNQTQKALIDALEQRLNYCNTKADTPFARVFQRRPIELLESAIAAAKAGKPVDYDELHAPPGYPPLPRCDKR